MDRLFYLGYTSGMEDETVAELIRRNRKASKLTQRELGDAIGITGRRVSEWEAGRAVPGRDAAYGLARVFNMNPGEIIRRILHPEDSIVEQAWAEDAKGGGHPEDGVHLEEARRLAALLVNHPRAFERWMAYGQGLVDNLRDIS